MESPNGIPVPLSLWAAVLLGLGLVQAVAGVLRHRCAVFNWLSAAYRTVQVTVRHAGHLGATLPKRLASGEVINVGTSDVSQIGNAIDVTARGVGAVVAIITVAVILLNASLPLGLIVVLGVPVLMTIVGILIRPLHRRQHEYRSATAELTTRAADIVTGLRVLRGIGGEATFSNRYRAESQRVRAAGVRVARVESLLEALQVLLPGVFVALVTWLGARFAVAGEINLGQLLAFYGYAVFLLFPLRTLTEVADKITRGHVAARRVVRILAMQPELTDPVTPAPTPDPEHANLVDPESGVIIRPGRLTAVAAAKPEDAVTIADRLGRYVDGPARLDGVLLADLDRATVRQLVLVADNDARLFSGRLRDELSGGRTVAIERLREALHAASAEDVIEASARGPRHPRRGAGSGVLRRPAAAAAADPGAGVGLAGVGAGGADQRGRRAHRGAHRQPALGSARRTYDGRLQHEPSDPRPGRPRHLCRIGSGRGRGHPPPTTRHLARLRRPTRTSERGSGAAAPGRGGRSGTATLLSMTSGSGRREGVAFSAARPSEPGSNERADHPASGLDEAGTAVRAHAHASAPA